MGSHCIAEAGALIGKVISQRGIATRWGGDEYSAVLPSHGDEHGLSVAD